MLALRQHSFSNTAHALPFQATGIINISVKVCDHFLAWHLCQTAASNDYGDAVLPAGYKATQAYRDDGSF